MSDLIDDFVNKINEDSSYIDEKGNKKHDIEATRIDQNYFTPKLEDIRVGYECEIFCKRVINGEYDTKEIYDKSVEEAEEKWYPHKFGLSTFAYKDNEGKFKVIEGNIIIGKIDWFRTPYLTKEQIEKEGWDAKEDVVKNELGTFKAFCGFKGNYMVSYINGKLSVLVKDPIKHEIEFGTLSSVIIIEINCPSINEFRYIMKLLGI